MSELNIVMASGLTADQRQRIAAFRMDYEDLARKHGMRFIACSCRGGVGIQAHDFFLENYEDHTPEDANDWAKDAVWE